MKQRLIAAIFLLIGLGMLAGGIALGIHTKHFIATAIRVPGEVVGLVQRRGDDGPTYAPRFTFTDQEGRQHTVEARTASNPPSFSVGEAVTVLYAPGRPGSAVIDSFVQLWLGTTVLSVMGGVFTLVGGGLLGVAQVVSRRRRPAAADPWATAAGGDEVVPIGRDDPPPADRDEESRRLPDA
jgi:hypothetical protein